MKQDLQTKKKRRVDPSYWDAIDRIQVSEIGQVCRECGISANVLTCLKKYGMPPKRLAFDVSTFGGGVCDYCGETKDVTEVRDFFYPDFNLLKKYVR